MLTRAKVLKSSLAFSLGRIRVQIGRRFYDLGLTPKMVDDITIQAIADLRKHGTWPELDDEAQPSPNWHGPSGGPWARDARLFRAYPASAWPNRVQAA